MHAPVEGRAYLLCLGSTIFFFHFIKVIHTPCRNLQNLEPKKQKEINITHDSTSYEGSELIFWFISF